MLLGVRKRKRKVRVVIKTRVFHNTSQPFVITYIHWIPDFVPILDLYMVEEILNKFSSWKSDEEYVVSYYQSITDPEKETESYS